MKIDWLGLLTATSNLAPEKLAAEWGGGARSHHAGHDTDNEWILESRMFKPVELLHDHSSFCLVFAEDDTDIAAIP